MTVDGAVSSIQDAAISVGGARKTYGQGGAEVKALDGVTVEFQRGTFSAIMGPSGSGKSTLMHTMAGLDTIDSGSIHIGTTEITNMKEKKLTKLRRDRIGFVFQSFNLVPTLTALENITLPLTLAGTKPEKEWLDKVVSTVGLQDRLSHRPSELSGGQQQRVAVARALTSKPDIIFADEPTGNLDSKSGTEVLEFMAHVVAEFGQTIVMVTHDANAASHANRVVFLSDGRIVDEMSNPTAETILDRIKGLGEDQ